MEVRKMKLSQIGLLAFLSWCLLVPPPKSDGRPNLNAPLAQWATIGGRTFEGQKSCMKALIELRKSLDKMPIGSARDRLSEIFSAGQCVPVDDPRLKGKPTPGVLPAPSRATPKT
jgi:hypothetical protein